ncbi:MAG: F0F1 ATP synthase subunit A [Chloroflexota bacterium]|nr:F0F1 ATP synthase subunit A [Chloroflexota bacterium]
MAISGSAKGILVLVALAVLALGLAGFITGAIGAAFFDRESFLPTPGVHLAPQEILGSEPGHELKEGGFDFVITNTILSSIVTSLVLILLFVGGTARMSVVPGRLQSLLESIVEALLGFVESVMGAGKGRGIFPLAATIFLFVAFNSWLALIPIYQSFGVIKDDKIYATFLRPAGTDLNMPLALALISFFVVEYLGFRAHGVGYLGEFIRFGQLLRGRILTGLIDLFVGVLEAVSHVVRVVSFTFRLFGNMTAGEILLLVTSFLVTFIFSVPFYGLELMVGLIQGVIFAALTVVFAAIAVAPHEGEEEH